MLTMLEQFPACTLLIGSQSRNLLGTLPPFQMLTVSNICKHTSAKVSFALFQFLMLNDTQSCLCMLYNNLQYFKTLKSTSITCG